MDDRIFELVEQWDDARRAGRDVSAQELCRECPELLSQVVQGIDAIKSTEWMERAPSEDQPAAEPRAAGSFIGRYRLDALVGQGGFGEVWKAFDPQLERFVAVKIPALDRPLRSTPHSDRIHENEKFLAEARKVARLKHPGIVPVYDVGQDDGVGYIVSDLVNGQNLADYAKDRRLPFRVAALLVADVADALDYAHRQGFVHRDVKPQNILIDEHGRPHLTDFGIAVSEEQPARDHNATAGTLPYMSPEQAHGQTHKIDSRTDIYSLGVVLYELLAGRPPYVAKTPADLWTAITSQSPRPLRTIDPTIPIPLERVCLQALSKEPAERFSTAGDFAAAVRAAASGQRRPAWPLGIAAVAILAILTVAFVRQQGSANRQARQDAAAPSGTSQAATPQPIPSSAVHLELTGRDLSDEDFRAISRCTGLRELILRDTPTTDAKLKLLEACQGLQQLDLGGTPITDKATDVLEKLPALTDLSLARTRITDDALDDLRDHRLRRLDLSGTIVTSDGIKDLAEKKAAATSLQWLDLSRTAVDDTAVEFLPSLSRLEELRLSGTSVSPAAIEQLKAALPNCMIVTAH